MCFGSTVAVNMDARMARVLAVLPRTGRLVSTSLGRGLKDCRRRKEVRDDGR